MERNRKILRELAARYYEIANSDTNRRHILHHKQVNDLKQPRPIVLIDEIPWQEMNIDNELTLQCDTEEARQIETFFRQAIYKWEHLRADMVLRPYYAVGKVIHASGIGFSRRQNQDGEHQNVKSHVFKDQIQTEEDIEKLHFETITYDEAATNQQFEFAADLFGGILPVKITGAASGGYGLACRTWDEIVDLRGLVWLFYDLIERPEFIHKLVGKLSDIYMDRIRQFEELELFDTDSYYIHCTAALTNDLTPDHAHPKAKDCWGRSMAQIFASVSPEMHEEFDTDYMVKTMAPFGLVYYGCCEPLHKKIHIIERIPNLRKISITPWADVDAAAEIMQDKYVVSAKPNPAALADTSLSRSDVRRELDNIISACRRNNCSCELVLKDITTVSGDPRNLFAWEQVAMEAVQNW